MHKFAAFNLIVRRKRGLIKYAQLARVEQTRHFKLNLLLRVGRFVLFYFFFYFFA